VAERRTLGLEPLVFSDEEGAGTAPEPGAAAAKAAPPPPLPSASLVSALVEPFFKRRAEEGRTSHHDVNQERGTLRRLPTTYGKSPQGPPPPSLAEIIAEADAKGAPRLGTRP